MYVLIIASSIYFVTYTVNRNMVLIGSDNEREVGTDHGIVKRPDDGNHDAGDDRSHMKRFAILQLCVHSFSMCSRLLPASLRRDVSALTNRMRKVK